MPIKTNETPLSILRLRKKSRSHTSLGRRIETLQKYFQRVVRQETSEQKNLMMARQSCGMVTA